MQSMLLVDTFFHLRQQNLQNKLHDILLWNMQNIKKIAKHNLMQNHIKHKKTNLTKLVKGFLASCLY
jgi:hypothetical protein